MMEFNFIFCQASLANSFKGYLFTFHSTSAQIDILSLVL